jgi:hypothetical protein
MEPSGPVMGLLYFYVKLANNYERGFAFLAIYCCDVARALPDVSKGLKSLIVTVQLKYCRILPSGRI